jgi:hypothetical protein
MNQSELARRRQRVQRKLAASNAWHSGRVDRLEEALRAIERELGAGQGREAAGIQGSARR